MRRKPTRFIDTRLSVDTGGDWKAHTGTVPKDCAVIGTVTLGASDTGALVRLAGSTNYVKVNAGKIAMLNQRAVITALEMAERQPYAPEMVSVEEWERTHPPSAEADEPQGHTASVTQGGGGTGLQAPTLAPRRH
jgi:hypothetical protein